MNHSSNDHQHHHHHPPLPTQPAPVADIGSNLIVNPSTSTPQEAQQQQHVGMSMAMTFHFGTDETILFSFWDTNSELWLFLVSWIIIFVISFLYEGLKFYREKLYKDSIRRASGASSTDRESDSSGGRIPVISASGDGDRESDEGLPIRIYLFTSTHFLQTFLHMIQIILSYTLMLIFMTYNVWLCAAVILGAGAGYLLFGWKRAIVGFDVTEHCQ